MQFCACRKPDHHHLPRHACLLRRMPQTPSPLGEKVPEGRMRGPRFPASSPSPVGQMTYGCAINGANVARQEHAAASQGLTSSPRGERGSRQCQAR